MPKPKPKSLTFVAEAEPMLVYRLEDGTTLRVKVVLMRVAFRDMNATTKLPVYDLQLHYVIDVEPGPNLIDTPMKETHK